MTQLRQELYAVQSDLRVVKNRLMKRALEGEKFSGLEEHLAGPTAIAFVKDDPVRVAKILTKYAEEFEPLQLRAGVMRGEIIGPKEIAALSKLPSKEELYAKLLATLMAPITSVVRALNGVPTKVVQVLAAVKDTKE
jgi:large subunit ribosomal protein L10